MAAATDLGILNWPELVENRIEVGPDIALQPIMNLFSGTLIGYEALSRFPETPGIGPDIWFHQALLMNLDRELEVAAVAAALELLPTIPIPLYLSVNASALTILSEPFILTILGRFSNRLVLELTEHDAVDNYAELRHNLERVRSIGGREGIRLGIDDVGAGFASMKHILQLDPDIFKLDISLTRDIDKEVNHKQALLVGALALFAFQAGVSIVAEGIETEAERNTLKDLGVANGQGYLLGRPVVHRTST